MSKGDKRWHSLLKDLERYALSSHDLPTPNQRLFNDVLILWVGRLCDILRVSTDDPPEVIYRVVKRWLTTVKNMDMITVLAICDKASGVLLSLETTSYAGFKHQVRQDFREAGEIISPVARILHNWFQSKDQLSFSHAYSFFSFPLRSNLDREELRDKALREYLEVEARLRDPIGDPLNIGSLIRSWSSNFDVDDLYPRHGPGSTADSGRRIDTKYQNLGTDARINYLNLTFTPHLKIPSKSFERISKLVFVPKSYKALRSISMEPATLMWYQQAVCRGINCAIRRSYLSRHYRPESPDLNRSLAFEGSIDGSYSTIDLSSASDSVQWGLVKKIFAKSPILRYLVCTRSTHTRLPDDRVIELNKFAPMGSALCFPIETLLFTSIALMLQRKHRDLPVDRIAVYGDDIVVPTEMSSDIIYWLNEYGFSVNTKKTFIRPPVDGICFRESCGGEYLGGMDVTPLRIPRFFSGLPTRDNIHQTAASNIDLCNSAQYASPSVRRLIIDRFLMLPSDLRPFFDSTGERGIFSPSPSNHHVRSRWNQNYQRTEYRCGRTKVPSSPGSPEFRYIETLREIDGRVALSDYRASVGRVDSPVWIPGWIGEW